MRVWVVVVFLATQFTLGISAWGEVLVRVSPGTYVHGIAAADGHIWLAMEDGLYRIDGTSAEEILTGLTATTIAEVRGEVWAGTQNGVLRIREGAPELLKGGHRNDLYVTSILSVDNTVWLGARQGLFRLNLDNLQANGDLFPDPTIDSIVHKIKKTENAIWIAARNNAYWIGGDDTPTAVFNPQIPGDVVDIAEANGSIWLVTQIGSRYGSCFRVTEDGRYEEVLSAYDVTSVAQIRGEVWIGTTEGVLRFREDHLPEIPIGRIGEAVNAIAEAGSYIWIGTRQRAYRSSDGVNFSVFPEGARFDAMGFDVVAGYTWVRSSIGAYRLDEDVDIVVDLSTFLIPYLVVGREIEVKPHYDREGRNPYGDEISANFSAIAHSDAETYKESVAHDNYIPVQSLRLEIKSFGIERLHIKTRDAFGNTKEDHSRSVLVVPRSALIMIALFAFFSILFVIAPISETAMTLLMMPLLRRYGSGLLVPLLLHISRRCRRHILRRYRYGLLANEDFTGWSSGRRSVLREDIAGVLREGRRFLLIANDGSAELHLRELTWRFASDQLPSRHGFFPIFLRLRPYTTEVGGLSQGATFRLRDLGGISDLKLGESLLQRGGFVFLLSGLNELDDEQMVVLERFISEYSGRNLIVIGSDEEDTKRLSEFKIIAAEGNVVSSGR